MRTRGGFGRNFVATSLALFVVVYFFLGGAFLYFVDRLIKKGPDEAEALPHGPPEPVPQAMQGARPALVVEGGGETASEKAR